jgi:hypothetical protein
MAAHPSIYHFLSHLLCLQPLILNHYRSIVSYLIPSFEHPYDPSLGQKGVNIIVQTPPSDASKCKVVFKSLNRPNVFATPLSLVNYFVEKAFIP